MGRFVKGGVALTGTGCHTMHRDVWFECACPFRKIAIAVAGPLEVWGTGEQTRNWTYTSEAPVRRQLRRIGRTW